VAVNFSGGEHHRPAASHWQTLWHNFVSRKAGHEWGFELTTLVVIDTDCICSCKSNYDMFTTTTSPLHVVSLRFYYMYYLYGFITCSIIHSLELMIAIASPTYGYSWHIFQINHYCYVEFQSEKEGRLSLSITIRLVSLQSSSHFFLDFSLKKWNKNSLKIPKRNHKPSIRGQTLHRLKDKKKKTMTKGRSFICKTLKRKLKIEQYEPLYNLRVNWGAPERYAVPLPSVTPVVLLLLQTRK